jgi:hypothetical protein
MTEGTMDIDVGGGRERRVRVDYPGNSKKAKETPPEKPPVEKVISGDVVQRKTGVASKVVRSFFAEDFHTVMNYVVMEVMVPAAKNLLSDAISQGAERMLNGDSRPRSSAGSRPGYTSYNAVSRPTMTRQERATHDFRTIIIGSRGEAEDVLDNLRNLINQYQVATVADFYDLTGVSSDFTDRKWGWDDLRSANVRPIRGGYLLDLPRTMPFVD